MKLSIIGAGNVAHQLGSLLSQVGIIIIDVYSRSEERSSELASKFKCKVADSLDKLEGDHILVCISDDAITEVLPLLPLEKSVIYTSGSTHLNSCGRSENTGVLYPLQTLKKEQDPNSPNLPLLIEAQNIELLQRISDLAKRISSNVHEVSSDDRLFYHLSAVWMNNFTTHMVHLSEELLNQRNLDFHLLQPLLLETLQKLATNKPSNIQTGPARRGDNRILQLHASLLTEKQRALYLLLSESIKDTYRTHDKL